VLKGRIPKGQVSKCQKIKKNNIYSIPSVTMYFLSMEMIQIRTEIRGMWFPEKPSLEK